MEAEYNLAEITAIVCAEKFILSREVRRTLVCTAIALNRRAGSRSTAVK
jgi:hypothetical protein